MVRRSNQMTSFTYPIYIQATPERVWQGLTDPALMKRYWRHQRAGEKTFQSDWEEGFHLRHGARGGRAVVSDPNK